MNTIADFRRFYAEFIVKSAGGDSGRLMEAIATVPREDFLGPGPWQVFGSARIPLDEMVKIDYQYGANWSLWLDMKILLRTVPFVLGRRGL